MNASFCRYQSLRRYNPGMRKFSVGRHAASQTRFVFLAAQWQDLVMLNYEVDPCLLRQYVPTGTELDLFDGKTYVSLVGFRFHRTKMAGVISIPFHVNFAEVNLRFYVCRKMGSEERRGVAFLAEIVPKRVVARIARAVYSENYFCFPMRHFQMMEAAKKIVGYEWRAHDRWCKLRAEVCGIPEHPAEGSLEQFITEHYWGYVTQRNGQCLEYHVEHPRWRVWKSELAGLEGDTSSVYGPELGEVLQSKPDCTFVADGSPVTVYAGRKVE